MVSSTHPLHFHLRIAYHMYIKKLGVRGNALSAQKRATHSHYANKMSLTHTHARALPPSHSIYGDEKDRTYAVAVAGAVRGVSAEHFGTPAFTIWISRALRLAPRQVGPHEAATGSGHAGSSDQDDEELEGCR